MVVAGIGDALGVVVLVGPSAASRPSRDRLRRRGARPCPVVRGGNTVAMRSRCPTPKPPAFEPARRSVYTSRLLGVDPDLVMHGGGNTSVKVTEPDLFGDRSTCST